MTRHAATWLVRLAPALFAASMVLPVRLDTSRPMWGFQMAGLSLAGCLMLIPLCIFGFIGNALFATVSVMVVVRVARGRPGPSFGLIYRMGVAAMLAMVGSWAWLQLAVHEIGALLSPGGWAWVASAVTLVIGARELRGEAKGVELRGFEVIPVAARAVEQDPPNP